PDLLSVLLVATVIATRGDRRTRPSAGDAAVRHPTRRRGKRGEVHPVSRLGLAHACPLFPSRHPSINDRVKFGEGLSGSRSRASARATPVTVSLKGDIRRVTVAG